MDLRTRYTALVTLTTQHVKYISDALRRLEEEEVRAGVQMEAALTTLLGLQQKLAKAMGRRVFTLQRNSA